MRPVREGESQEHPGHRALRAGRESVAGEWYAITTRGAIEDLRPVARVVIDEARRLEGEGYIRLHVIVVMPDHCHMMFELLGPSSLPRVMQLIKGRSSRTANQALSRKGPLWMEAYYEHLIHDGRDAHEQWWYFVQNPVREGLADRWDDYAHTYTGQHAI